MPLDLSPAKWIWLPSERTLANTVVLFRKAVTFQGPPKEATGFISADSRYRLWINGERVQWGPAPCDPRHGEADPIDLTGLLRSGDNVIAVEVLYFGHPEGTWPCGKPGLIMRLEVDGEAIATDETWRCEIDRSRPAGGYRRWYLRSLQEIVDARQGLPGWTASGFDDSGWLSAMDLRVPPTRTPYSGPYREYAVETWMTRPEESTLIARTIPLMREEIIRPSRLRARGAVIWRRPPEDWFENRIPGAFSITSTVVDEPPGPVVLPPGGARTLTYEFPHEHVGFPYFEIEAPAGTVVDLMVQESHDPAARPWLDSHHFQWSRYTCRGGGPERFEALDYEALRWIGLHVRDHSAPVTIREVGLRRRSCAWPHEAEVRTDDPKLQAVWDAAVRTLANSAQDVVVDGMGRERQQYSGDASHQLVALRLTHGDETVPARFLRTFGQGQFLSGVFSDSWPAADRLMRIWERQVDGSVWGPIIDHSIGFVLDHHAHWMHTGDLAPFLANADKLARFIEFLRTDAEKNGGLVAAVRDDEHTVWLDHDAYPTQAHRLVALNLSIVGMLETGYLPMLKAAERPTDEMETFADALLTRVKEIGYDDKRKLFVAGRPAGDDHVDDRALATAVLYGLNPDGDEESLRALADPASGIGQSYPANRVWNAWALIKGGRVQPLIDELRTRWASMRSVEEAGTLQEIWVSRSDSSDLMCHCPQMPLITLHQGLVGLAPTEPGFAAYTVRPQLGDIKELTTTTYTPLGALHLEVDERKVRFQVLPSGRGTLHWRGETRPLKPGETVELSRL